LTWPTGRKFSDVSPGVERCEIAESLIEDADFLGPGGSD
jgi:hypothetical protein